MRRSLLLATLLVLALSIISTVFSILTAASPRWAVQHYFKGFAGSEENYETAVICSAHRSPFYRCGLPRVAEDSDNCEVPSCRFYPPYGNNRTSCRLAAELGPNAKDDAQRDGVLGNEQECQEVHIAGNLQIAATTFTGLGLLTTLAFLANIFLSHRRRQHPESTAKTESSAHHRAHHSATLSFLTAALILFFLLGAALQILAQFFGTLALTLNATPNESVAESTAEGGFNFFAAAEWTLDIALVRYASVSWLSGVLCAVGGGWLFWRSGMSLRG